MKSTKTTLRRASGGKTLFSLLFILILAIATLVLSGNFETLISPFAPLIKPFAAFGGAKVNTTFTDAFSDQVINTEKWQIWKTDGVTLTETANNTLRMDVAAGSYNNKRRSGYLGFKKLLEAGTDFMLSVDVSRPVVATDGAGMVGISFASAGNLDLEGARLAWRVIGTNSQLVFSVRAPDGTMVDKASVPLNANRVLLRLVRAGTKYSAVYKFGNMDDDYRWTSVGSAENISLGGDGYVGLFANNVGAAGKYPKVIGVFDTATIKWYEEDVPVTRNWFSDNFADQKINEEKWRVYTNGASIIETPYYNLELRVALGSKDDKAKLGALVFNELIGNGKNFNIRTQMFKPTVVGEGIGMAGIRFVSLGSEDDELARVSWNVSATMSDLVFVVKAPDGTRIEAARTPVAANKVTVRMWRNGTKYRAQYKIGNDDPDVPWNNLGSAQNVTLGGDGYVQIMASNTGAEEKFPRVVGKLDRIIIGWQP